MKNKQYTHYRNLYLFAEMGMKFRKLNEVLRFKQKKWLKRYIDLNTDLWSKAENQFQQKFRTSMKNVFCGKFAENTKETANHGNCWRSC